MMEDMNEVNDALGRNYGVSDDIDEADLDAELAGLEDELEGMGDMEGEKGGEGEDGGEEGKEGRRDVFMGTTNFCQPACVPKTILIIFQPFPPPPSLLLTSQLTQPGPPRRAPRRISCPASRSTCPRPG